MSHPHRFDSMYLYQLFYVSRSFALIANKMCHFRFTIRIHTFFSSFISIFFFFFLCSGVYSLIRSIIVCWICLLLMRFCTLYIFFSSVLCFIFFYSSNGFIIHAASRKFFFCSVSDCFIAN